MDNRKITTVDINKLESVIVKRRMSVDDLENACYFSKGYINQVRHRKGRMLNLKYMQLVSTLKIPYGELLADSAPKPSVSVSNRIKVDYDAIKKYIKSQNLTIVEISTKLNWAIGYFNKIKNNNDSTMSNPRYNQLIDFFKLPYGTFIVYGLEPELEPNSKTKTFGELLSSGDITLEEFKQQHPSTTEQEPEQIELISIEHEMLLEMQKLTSTMQAILNVVKGWE